MHSLLTVIIIVWGRCAVSTSAGVPQPTAPLTFCCLGLLPWQTILRERSTYYSHPHRHRHGYHQHHRHCHGDCHHRLISLSIYKPRPCQRFSQRFFRVFVLLNSFTVRKTRIVLVTLLARWEDHREGKLASWKIENQIKRVFVAACMFFLFPSTSEN